MEPPKRMCAGDSFDEGGEGMDGGDAGNDFPERGNDLVRYPDHYHDVRAISNMFNNRIL